LYVHLAVILSASILLALINFFTSPDDWWAKWPLIGWGFAVVIHALFVFVFTGSLVTAEMIEREMRNGK